jgi:hypothetical protein
MLEQLTSPQAMKLIAQVEQPFKGLPHLPKGLVDFLVGIAPWLVGLGGVLSIIGGLSLLGNTSGMQSNMWMQLAGISPAYFLLSGVISLVSGALMLMAFKPLKNKELKGWVYMFWLELINVVQMAVGVAFGASSIVGMVIGLAIGFYILFELKPSYKA